MKRIIVKLSMLVPDEITAGGVIEKIGMTPKNEKIHINYKEVSLNDSHERILKKSDLIAYAVELK